MKISSAFLSIIFFFAAPMAFSAPTPTAQINTWLMEIQSQLPKKIRDLNLQFQVQYSLSPEVSSGQICDAPQAKLIQSRLQGKTLHVRMAEAFQETSNSSCDLFRQAQVLLLGEIIQVLDNRPVISELDQIRLQKCEGLKQDPQTCASELGLEKAISTRGPFLSLIWRGARQRGNEMSARIVNSSELSSPQAALKVNFAEFILNPRYVCHRPSLARFFNQYFEVSPSPQNCGSMRILVDTSEPLEHRIKELNVSQVYRIDYLLADQGTAMSSRWGHSMFRIVICAPTRRVPGPECLQDVNYHLVASFRASVSDITISTIKGIFGSYASRMFLIPLNHVRHEYTRGELRNLVSYPLQISQEEKETLFDRILEAYWEYNGSYRFITNNCASETDQLLKSVLQRPGLQDLQVNTPMGLRDFLFQVGLISPNVSPQVFTSEQKQISRSLTVLGVQKKGDLDSLELRTLFLQIRQQNQPQISQWAHLRLLIDRSLLVNRLNMHSQLQLFVEKAKDLKSAPAELLEIKSGIMKVLGEKPQDYLHQKGYGIAYAGELDFSIPKGPAELQDPSDNFIQKHFPKSHAEALALKKLLDEVDQEMSR